MSLKNKTFQIILNIICGLFLVMALFLSVTAVVYSAGGGNPNVFGMNIYIVKTDAFDFLHNGTALMAKQVPNSEIQSSNIVIFELENGKPALAQVISSSLSDGVYSFNVLTENKAEIVLSQSQIVAKGMSYSDFLGGLIRFVMSPFGLLLIAIAPSIIMIILEIVKFAAKIMPQPEIETVKKQYEVPTYSPERDRAARDRRGLAEASKAYRNSSLDSSIGIYEPGRKEQSPVGRKTPAGRQTNEYADIAARQQAPLFTAPTRPKTQQSGNAPVRTIPLSQKKLNDAIEATKAEHELDDMKKVRAQIVKDIQKTRGAAIAAEKEFETSERLIGQEARKTANIARTTVIETFPGRETSDITEAAARAAAAEKSQAQQSKAPKQQRLLQPKASQPASGQNPQAQQPRRPTRPQLRLSQEEPVKQYTPRSGSNTTTSIPRLDSLLKDDGDQPFNIDEILAGLDKRRV